LRNLAIAATALFLVQFGGAQLMSQFQEKKKSPSAPTAADSHVEKQAIQSLPAPSPAAQNPAAPAQ
jgi:hypothetical protein